jgi:hypothetical protein
MQPKFTQKNLGYFCTRIIALALIFSASTQFSFAQQNPARENTLTLDQYQKLKGKQSPKQEQQVNTGPTKASLINTRDLEKVKVGNINKDAGIHFMDSHELESPQACAWTASTVYPIPVLDQANAVVGANLYSFTGVSNGVLVANSYRFDGTVWTAIAAFPATTEFPSAVGDGTNVYIMSGVSGGVTTTTLRRYNVGANTYTTLASCGTATWNQTAQYFNGKIYKFGGFGPATGTETNVLEIYDIAANTWTTGAPYPIAVGFLSSWVQGGFIYGAGGTTGGGIESLKTYRYDPVANTWNDAAIADLPATRWGAVSDFYSTGGVVAGGYSVGVITNTAFQWDIGPNTWSALPNMIGDRARMSGATLSGSLYVIGGRSTAVGGFTGTNNNQRLFCDALTPCSGTPNAGNTLSSINPVCPSVPFTLSLSNTLSGLTYQWQISTTGVGGPFSNIAGATGSTYTTSIVTATAYRCIVTCTASGLSGNSVPLLENVNPPSACYCSGGATDVVDEKISRVRYNTIDNSSTSTAGYEDFTAISTTVIQGSTQDITVNISNFFTGDLVRVWIDFNQNGNFTDPGERVVATTNTAANPAIASITIPVTTSIGPTRMRVRMYWQPSDPDPGPCGNTVYGQVEDYTVNIQPCIQGVFNTHPANISIQCGGNATFSITTTGSLLTYSWEYRLNASSPWLNVPALAPYSGTTTSTLTITDAPVTMNGYQYRAVIVGPCTAVDFSNVATLTVTPVIPLVTVTPASPICTGTIVQLSLTNVLAPVATTLINEGFTTVAPLPAGWASQNLSNPLGPTGWFQGDATVFPSQNGAPTAYIAANFNNTGAVGQISNWLFTPNITIKNGDVFTFWSRKVAPDAFPDRLQVRRSLNGASTNVGATALTVGDFSTLLLDINSTEVTGVYPIVWTQYTITISGVPVPTSGRLAFRYFISNAGSAAPNGDYIGIDNVVYTSITGGIAAGIWTSSPAAPNSMFTDPAAGTAYVAGTPINTIYVKPLAPLTSTSYSVFFTTPTPCTSATTVVPINISSPVNITTAPANRTACVGTNTSFSVVSGGTPLTYQWEVSVNNGLTWSSISGATAATLNLNGVTQLMNNNLYRVTVTAAPCGSSTTAAARLNVLQLPVVTISSSTLQLVPGRIATITGSSSPAAFSATSWSWTLNGSTIAGATGNTVTANIDQQGSYRATVTDNQILNPVSPLGGCTNSSNIVTIGSEASDRLWIYPNPNTGSFQVRLYYNGAQAERRIVRIYSTVGQLMAQKEFDLVTGTPPYLSMTFNLPTLAAGTYAVKVVDKNSKQITSGLVVIQ